MGHADQSTNDQKAGNDHAVVPKSVPAVQPEGATCCSDNSADTKVKTLTCSLTGMAPLFTPIKIGSLQLTHRIIMAPLTRCRASPEGVPNTELAGTYYTQRTTKGGLIISEATNISRQATGHFCAPGIYTPAQVEAWKSITSAIQKKGGFIFLQLWHVGRGSHSKYQPDGRPPVGPSPIAIKEETSLPDGSLAPFEVPRELTLEEITAIVEDYRKATKNAFLAGFDGVEVHGANGYLIDQFLHDGSNQRKDKYGGSYENRARFLLEVVEAVQQTWIEAAGAGSPKAANVGLRLAPFGKYQDMSDSHEAELYGYVIPNLNRFNLAYLHVVEPRVIGSTAAGPEAVEVVHSLGKTYNGPWITAGGYRPDDANKTVMDAAHSDPPRAVAVAFGRLFIANPDLPLRIFLRAPLHHYNRATFYTHDAVGYTDQPFLAAGDIVEGVKELRVEQPDNQKLQNAIEGEIQLLKVQA
ncbi:12-oxophytodienoate reductase 1 [Hypsibius exemplaris]|uniref:12-oxophytodienoate reductase 1 n=1 Tax=Hypsibius exemplaris TaxID=2072580 RepID=A0A9X6NJV5_HYPEX|nr:12-oxophytodienoate reductase 1 [Hypsibius exemplaris]